MCAMSTHRIKVSNKPEQVVMFHHYTSVFSLRWRAYTYITHSSSKILATSNFFNILQFPIWLRLYKSRPDYVHLWVKISIQNVFVIVSRRRNSKILPSSCFSCVFDKIFMVTVINVVPNADIFRYFQFSTEYGRMFTWMRI